MADEIRPIIIKKKKIMAAGHHGGAWKVAYADFVTAMMAFFLLMWLLNATTEEQRKGIADYFSPNIPLAAVSGGGPDALNGDSMFTQQSLIRTGTGAESDDGNGKGKDDKDSLKASEIEALNEAMLKEDAGLLEHVSLKMSPEGLVIELVDSETDPLFSVGDATASELLEKLLKVVSQSFGDVKNNVKIVGHTDALAFSNTNRYSNWELSADRANTARRLLVDYGFPYEQISEISGKASTDPLTDNPLAAKNRRISLTLLN